MPIGWLLKLMGMLSGINIKKMFGIILVNWREAIIMLLVIVVIYQNKFETRYFFGAETIPALEADLVVAENNLQKCVDGNKILSTAIEQNNSRIAAYKQVEIAMRADITRLSADLATARDNTNVAVEVILTDPTPQTCESAIDYLRDAGRELKW